MKTQKLSGMNRTGLAASPMDGKLMLEVTGMTRPSSAGAAADTLSVRREYADKAEPTGSLPPPASGKQLLGMALDAMQGVAPTLLVDKLGERLAFERTGTRLYDGILLKLEAYGSWKGGPTRQELEGIRSDEHRHFLMLKESIEQLGGDPTAVTPSANLHAWVSSGLPAVIGDPRTTLQQCLEAMIVAELVDNDCWSSLIQLARMGGHDFAESFEEAIVDEQRHLTLVRGWLAASMGTMPLTTPQELPEMATAPVRRQAKRSPVPETSHGAPGGRKTVRRQPTSRAGKQSTARRTR